MATAAAAGGGDVFPSSSSPRYFPWLSPKNRLKFLCSYGGKILPRPSDGHLKYVGGHTRVLAVPRSISFSELKEKIEGMFCCSGVAIKYQLAADDLDDALVSVTCDEDLAHMLDEYDRLDALQPGFLAFSCSASSPRFRLFLFPPASSNPGSPRRPVFTVSASSSGTSSPTATVDAHADALALRLNALLGPSGGGSGEGTTHRVRSTPNLSGGGGLQTDNGATSPHHHHNQYHHHPQQRLLRRQKSSGASSYRAQAAGGGGAWKAGVWVPQTAMRGGLQHGCVSFGHWEESSSRGASRSSSPFRALPRKPLMWG